MAPKPRFIDGEKVLCYHGPLLYEAKCLKSQIKEKHLKYFIHYSGWNKNWDEWVPECRVLKYNEANLQKQKELSKTHLKSKRSKPIKVINKRENEKESVQPSSEKPSKLKPEKKNCAILDQSTENLIDIKRNKPIIEPCFMDEVKGDVEIKIDILQPLKDWLIDDWDLITRQKKILVLPARVTVDHVIASYVKEKVSVKGLTQRMESTIVQISNRIRDCFNVLLGKMMLYKFERQQYAEMLSEYPGSSMCQIYGSIHLLRMFTKLGTLLTPLAFPEKDLSSLLQHLNDFIKYMSSNKSFFSLEDYVVASPEYHRRAVG